MKYMPMLGFTALRCVKYGIFRSLYNETSDKFYPVNNVLIFRLGQRKELQLDDKKS
jgi:hypothetical protein